MATTVSELRPRRRLEFDPNCELTPLAKEVMAYLIDGDISIAEISQRVGWSVPTIWRIRNKPALQAEYRKQLALVEQQAFDYAIARRVNRVAALNETWVKLNAEITKRKVPRSDQIYALIALQTAAAKEMGQDVQRVQMEVTQQVHVIKFEAQEPRKDLEAGLIDNVVDAQFREIRPDAPAEPQPEPEPFEQTLQAAGVVSRPAHMTPEYAAQLRRVVQESGLDPREVFSDSQFEELYGRKKEDDPWAI